MMAWGVFNSEGQHILTFEYGDCQSTAEKQARSKGYGYYARELTFDEYYERLKLIDALRRGVRK